MQTYWPVWWVWKWCKSHVTLFAFTRSRPKWTPLGSTWLHHHHSDSQQHQSCLELSSDQLIRRWFVHADKGQKESACFSFLGGVRWGHSLPPPLTSFLGKPLTCAVLAHANFVHVYAFWFGLSWNFFLNMLGSCCFLLSIGFCLYVEEGFNVYCR